MARHARESAIVRMDLLGANSDITMQPQDRLPGSTHYLMGSNRTKWPANLPTYAKARSLNVYAGIDLVYYGAQGQLEYDFVLAPGADASKIRLTFAGATPAIDSSGDLVLSLGGIRFRRPVLYQESQGVRQPVDGKFTIAANNDVGFEVGRYDHSRELVIDPVLVYASFLGGSAQQSVINAMTMNAAGEIYVTGITNAVDFPTTSGVVEESCPAPMTGGTKCGPSSSSAAFVSKISNDGQSLIYSTYLGGGGPGPGTGGSAYSQGGSGSDFGTGIAVDANDNAWVVGSTNSNNFPVTPDAYSLYYEPASKSFLTSIPVRTSESLPLAPDTTPAANTTTAGPIRCSWSSSTPWERIFSTALLWAGRKARFKGKSLSTRREISISVERRTLRLLELPRRLRSTYSPPHPPPINPRRRKAHGRLSSQ